jgi:hypothetical protein
MWHVPMLLLVCLLGASGNAQEVIVIVLFAAFIVDFKRERAVCASNGNMTAYAMRCCATASLLSKGHNLQSVLWYSYLEFYFAPFMLE